MGLGNLMFDGIVTDPDMVEGDYYENGLLMCGECHTPKQCVIRVLGQKRTVGCLCRCGVEKRDADEAERAKKAKMERIERMRMNGFPDTEMRKWTFDADDGKNEEASRIAKNYVKRFGEMLKKGKGLLMYGTVGTGKTFLSVCIANALIDQGHPCLVTNFARITNTLGGMYDGKQQYLDNLNSYDLLVIDDLGAERDTEFMGEVVQTIIDSRYRSGKPLIITTNLTSDELKHPSDIRRARTYSRLLEMCIPVEVAGRDRRKEILKRDYAELKKLLGEEQ
ncbi:MAG: ATP-binding protein [Anaerolineaceae bacterium]|nr:ATP-binding protein [Anaerolineaceae bacterium]